jgi:acyl-ACP thioesterase
MNTREEKFTVRAYDCQTNGTLKIFSLMQYLQEIATLHAEELGFGISHLDKINSYWVLSNIRIEFSRLPVWKEDISIQTWPSGYSRLIATREFTGKDRNKNELFRAGSQWMILSKDKNRPQNLFNLDLDMPNTGTKVISEKIKRLESKKENTLIEQMRVPYNSIDLNGHVNNTEYVRWGIDALSKIYKPKGKYFSFQATYLSELFEGDELDLLVGSINNHYSVLIKRTNSDEMVFLMENTFFNLKT